MGPGAQHVGRDDRSDAVLVEQVGSPIADDAQDLSFVLGRFAGEVTAPSSDCPQRSRCDATLEIPVVVDPQLAGCGHDRMCGHAGEPFTEVVGCCNDQRLELTLCIAGGFDGHGAHGDQHRQCRRVGLDCGAGRGVRGPVLRERRGRHRADRTWRLVDGQDALAGRVRSRLRLARRGVVRGLRRSRRCLRWPTLAMSSADRPLRPARHSRPCSPTGFGGRVRRPSGRTTAAVWVCLWVSTPMMTSTDSDNMVTAFLLFRKGRGVPVRFGVRQDCDGTRQMQPGGQAPDQASSSSRAGAGR